VTLWGSITLSRPLTCAVMAGPVAIMLLVRTRGLVRPRPSAAYLRCRQVGDRGRGDVVAVRWPRVPGPVRAIAVVVRGVLIQDSAQVRDPEMSILWGSAQAVRTQRSA
jgi:hypothetical protein